MPPIKETSVTVNIPPGAGADVHVTVYPAGEAPHEGVRTSVFIESPEDVKFYDELVTHLTVASGSVIEHNFDNGRDATANTPEDLRMALDILRAYVVGLYQNPQIGQKHAAEMLRRAKDEVFQKEPNIRELTKGKKGKLTGILRWQIKDALASPPPAPKAKK